MGNRVAIALAGEDAGDDLLRDTVSLGHWLRNLRHVADACESADEDDQAKLLRELRRLLAQAPCRAQLSGLIVPAGAWFETRLDQNCCETAVLAILAGDAGYLLSRGAAGSHMASVVLPGKSQECSAGGKTLALALAGAIARALLQSHL